MIKIDIGEKYLYIYKDFDPQKGYGKHIAYFEEFVDKKEPKNVIALAIEDNEGEKFLEENNYKIQYADVYWFSKKCLRYRVMFIKEKNGAFSYLILIVPKLLELIK